MQINLVQKNINEISPLALAYVGDAVFSLMVRQQLVIMHNVSEAKLTKLASFVVNAGNQCKIFKSWQPFLTETEADIARRARNANIHSKAKNFSIEEYIHATALEAVVGYLHLVGDTNRLQQLMQPVLEEL